MKKPLEIAKQTLIKQARALEKISSHINESFLDYCTKLSQTPYPIIISGLGKSGFIAKKIAATLTSLGIKSIYLHPTDALHGDMGIVSPNSYCILISKSGKTQELLDIHHHLKEKNCHCASITHDHSTVLAQAVDYSISLYTKDEADPLNTVPTTSTTCSMALGDCIATTIMTLKNTQPADFHRNHPSGTLGHLLTPISDSMHPLQSLYCISIDTPLENILKGLTKQHLGAICITENKNTLLGIITDGDIRRLPADKQNLTAHNIMVQKPVTIEETKCLKDALSLMQNRESEIAILPVLKENKLTGLIRLHDIIGKMP